MSNRSHLAIKMLLCAAMFLASPAVANARGGGGFGGGGFGHGGGFSGGGFSHGGGSGWHSGGFAGGAHGGGGVHVGGDFHGFHGYGYPYWGYDPYWYGWDYSDYGNYPYAYDPSDNAAPAQAPAAEAAQSYWYFCRSANRYYPYVQSCPESWQKVVPTAPSAQQGINGSTASTRAPQAESGSAE